MYILDSHNHLLDEPDYPEKLIETLDRLGIDAICLSGLGLGGYDAGTTTAPGLSSLSPRNEDVARCIAAHPDRIIGYASVILGQDGPETVRYWRRQGFLGVKFTRPKLPYNHDDCMPVYAEAARLDMPGLFHTGFVLRTPQDEQDDVDTDRMRPVLLDRVARRFQSWPFALAHMGLPWHAECAEMVRFHPNAFVDLSCGFQGWRDRMPVDFFRRHFYWPNAWKKVVFGTDLHYNYMESSLRSQERIFSYCHVPEDARRAIMGETVRTWLRRAAFLPIDEPCLEVIAATAAEARLAQDAGAGRIELLADLAEGGTTPPETMLREVASFARVPVTVMVRPRAGDFNYSPDEMNAMKATLALLGEIPFARQAMGRFGAVFGIQDETGRLDLTRMRELAETGRALGLEMACHRAFDNAFDRTVKGLPENGESAKNAAKALADTGFRRILTSGGPKEDAANNLPALAALNAAVQDRITIMPGVGITTENISLFARKGFPQIHMGKGAREDMRHDSPLRADAIRAAADALHG